LLPARAETVISITINRRPVQFYRRVVGSVPGVEELLAKIEERVGAAA
jgi:hypothetical protein